MYIFLGERKLPKLMLGMMETLNTLISIENRKKSHQLTNFQKSLRFRGFHKEVLLQNIEKKERKF